MPKPQLVGTGFGSYPIRLPPRSPSTTRWTGFQGPYPGLEIVGVTHGVSPRSQETSLAETGPPGHRLGWGGNQVGYDPGTASEASYWCLLAAWTVWTSIKLTIASGEG